MNESKRVHEQLRRAFQGEAWHGPSFAEAISGIGPSEAAAKPLATAHSIGEIVRHVSTWLDVVARRVTGVSVPSVSDEDDWPGLGNWQAALDQLAARQTRLLDVVDGLSDGQLSEPSTDGRSRYELIHGSVQHTLYHAGQIVLLGKAIREAK